MSKKKIYIAGPMTGLPDYNAPAFEAAAERLREYGCEVVSPVEMGKEYGTFEELEASPALLSQLIRAELNAVTQCAAIYLLRGWEKSKGTRRELETALRCHLEIILEPCALCPRGASGGKYYTPAAVRDFIAAEKEAK